MSGGHPIGIIGHRSWIAQALADELRRRGHSVRHVEKSDVAWTDASDLTCLYIIPGSIMQTDEEKDAEVYLASAVVLNPRACRRQILLSSRAVLRKDEYGIHKDRVELAYFSAGMQCCGQVLTLAVRPPAVFGPTQRPDSPMLIPSLAREWPRLELLRPDEAAEFIFVGDLVHHMANLAIEGYSSPDIPGTFSMTPRQLDALFKTWEALRSMRDRDE